MGPKLTIVIPALNEEQSIASIVERCLDQREGLLDECGLGEVEVVVVSDGSTDRTVEIARGYEPQIRLVVFPQNRGYGAAIKEGWRVSGGDLLAFLDADGTCDPALFVPMAQKALDGTDVVLGNRLHAGSRMPGIRRFGNRLFALLLGYLSRERVGDTASGMRVVRREALRFLYPLPDGLHFTPAMSAVCLVHEDLSIAEIEMPYREREGRSKLHVLKDGVRFLFVIFGAVMLLRPRRVTLPILGLLVVACLVLAAEPVMLYAQEQRIEEWHIHQLLLITVMGAVGAMLFGATYVAEHMISAGHLRLDRDVAGRDRIVSRNTFRALVVLSGLFCLGTVVFASPGLIEYLGEGQTSVHWSRFVLAMLAIVIFAQLFVTSLVVRFVRGLGRKLQALHGADAPAEPVEAAVP